jgi:hypothetical protein
VSPKPKSPAGEDSSSDLEDITKVISEDGKDSKNPSSDVDVKKEDSEEPQKEIVENVVDSCSDSSDSERPESPYSVLSIPEDNDKTTPVSEPPEPEEKEFPDIKDLKLPKTEKDNISEVGENEVHPVPVLKPTDLTPVKVVQRDTQRSKPIGKRKTEQGPKPWSGRFGAKGEGNERFERFMAHAYFSVGPDYKAVIQPVSITISEPTPDRGNLQLHIDLPGNPVQGGRFAFPRRLPVTPPKYRVEPYRKPVLSDDEGYEEENDA